MNFEEVIDCVGGIGYYQIFLMFYYYATTIISLEGGLTNFAGGTMNHWCHIPALQNFSHQEQKYIGIPGDAVNGKFERCYRFPIDYNNFTFQDLLKWNRSAMTGSIPTSAWIPCDKGWVYDQSQWISSIVSQVI